MATRSKKSKATKNGTEPLGFEAKLWAAADALRNNMDAAEYKHVVLGLIFLKYISDAFEAKREELEAQKKQGADPEDPDEYRAANIFWVPKEARWAHLKASAPQPNIGTVVDDAMAAIERDNPSLKAVLPKDFGRPNLDKQRLGQIINLVSDIALGSAADRAKDTLGRVYEYFLSRFASAEGKSGGQFYTPLHVVRVLVEMLAPYKGRVYDPCCGSPVTATNTNSARLLKPFQTNSLSPMRIAHPCSRAARKRSSTTAWHGHPRTCARLACWSRREEASSGSHLGEERSSQTIQTT
jgi:type I restriction enzyme M protein